MTPPIPASHGAPAPAAHPTRPAAGARHDWIDTLRGLATVLVVLLHASLVVELFDLAPWQPLLAFNLLFAPYRMALLMLLSGMLLSQALAKPPPEYTVRKLATLLYPYLLWTAVYGLFIHDEGMADPYLWIGGSYLWFILFLFTYYLCAGMTRGVSPLAIAVASFSLSLFAPEETKYIERYFFLMGFFFLGHLLAARPAVVASLTSGRALLVALPITLALSVSSVLRQGQGINYDTEYLLPSLAGVTLMIGVARRVSGLAWVTPLNFIGRHSVVFFAVHYPLIYGLILLCLAAGMASTPAITAVAFLAALAACWALADARERVAAVRLLFALPVRKPFIGRAALTSPARPTSREQNILPGS